MSALGAASGEALRGRVALVTGGSRGIGWALAAALARRGAQIALLARGRGALEGAAANLSARGAKATVHVADVGDRHAVGAAIEDAVATHGRLDGLVNCAGRGLHAAFRDHDPEDLEALVRTNVMGAIHATQLALPHLAASDRGFLVNVSSVAGRLGQPGEAVYSASKFALTGLSEALTIELSPLGIHVLTVYPGLVDTGFAPPEALSRLPRSLVSRALEPERLAEDVVRALLRGRHEITRPRSAAAALALRTLAPGVFRRILARVRGR